MEVQQSLGPQTQVERGAACAGGWAVHANMLMGAGNSSPHHMG